MVETRSERRVTDQVRGPVGVIAVIGAVASLVAGVWYWLIANQITVPAEPALGGLPDEEALRRFFGWQAAIEPQERFNAIVAIVAFACFLLVAREVARWLPGETPRTGSALVVLGSGLWIAGNLLELGGHGSAVFLATAGGPVEPPAAVDFVMNKVDDAFELAAFAAIAVGLLMLGIGVADRAWRIVTIALGATMAILAVTYALDAGAVTDMLLGVGGSILLPVWLVITGRRLRATTGQT